MGTTENVTGLTPAAIRELKAIGEAIFAEWYPNHRMGEPVPAHPPLHIQREAAEIAARARAVEAGRRSAIAA